MKMLASGGLEPLTDGVRGADASNPEGYYELERVKLLDQGGDVSWLYHARGKGVKVISHLLPFLPHDCTYHVLFLHRNLSEVVRSQNAMLASRGEESATDDERTVSILAEHVEKVRRFMSARRRMHVIELPHADLLREPLDQARRIREFLGVRLDAERMAAAVDPRLYRNRAG
jgi:hypothetical protein